MGMAEEKMVGEPPELKPAAAVRREGPLIRVRRVITTWFTGGGRVVSQHTSTELAQIRTDLAESRTLMAADRTLMAWFRTALSMYSFGFTIYKLLQGFQAAGGPLPQGQTPRNIGLFLTGMGTFAMIMGTIEYWSTFQHLRKLEPIRVLRPSLVMALLMCVMGIGLFFGIVTRIF
jgi:putative membrane protein